MSTSRITRVPIDQISPVGFHAKFLKAAEKPYKISSGKSKLLRRAIILLFLSLIIITASLKLIPEDAYGPEGWPELLLWLPRILSLGLALLAIMRIRDMKKVKEFLSFDPKGIQYDGKSYSWVDIEKVEVEYTTTSDEQFDLIVYTKEKEVRIDIKKVDEFSEDVAAVLHKYITQFGTGNPDEPKENADEEKV